MLIFELGWREMLNDEFGIKNRAGAMWVGWFFL